MYGIGGHAAGVQTTHSTGQIQSVTCSPETADSRAVPSAPLESKAGAQPDVGAARQWPTKGVLALSHDVCGG
jgi:hypothetical protein